MENPSRFYWLLGVVALVAGCVVIRARRTESDDSESGGVLEFVTVTATKIADEFWRVSLGLRNRNPGNIDYLPPSKAWRGQVGQNGRFGVYDTDQNGVRAIAQELLLEERRGAHTVAQQITVWAPPTENNTASYISAVSRALGVDSNTPISLNAYLPALVAAIVKHENGVNPYSDAQIQQWVWT